MKRKKLGDIYEFKINENITVYFQFLGKDTYQLGSDIVVFFNHRDTSDISMPTVEQIVNSGIWFVSHTWITPGVRNEFYKFLYNAQPIISANELYFRSDQEMYDSVKDDFIIMFFKRNPVTNEHIYYKNLEEYENATKEIWNDGAMHAEGFITRIPMKLKDPSYKHLY